MLAWDLKLTAQMGPVTTPCGQPPLALSNGPHLVYIPALPPCSIPVNNLMWLYRHNYPVVQ